MGIDAMGDRTLREASDLAKEAEESEGLELVQEYGGRLKDTLEKVDRTELQEPIRHKIELAIRHATNVHRAVNHHGGQHDAGKARELIAELLKEVAEPEDSPARGR